MSPVNQKARTRAWDLALAATVATLAMVEVWLPLPSVMGEGSRVLSSAIVLVTCGALALRRAHPLASTLVVLAAWPITYTITPVLVLFGPVVPIVVALYSVARLGSPRQRVAGALAGAATLLYFDLRVPELGEASEIVFHWMVCVVAFGLGFFVSSYERRAIAEAQRAAQAELSGRSRRCWPCPTNGRGSPESCTTSSLTR